VLTKQEALAKIAISQLSDQFEKGYVDCWQVSTESFTVFNSCLCLECVKKVDDDKDILYCGGANNSKLYVFFHTKEEAEAYAEELRNANR